jgi:hypothetical protein
MCNLGNVQAAMVNNDMAEVQLLVMQTTIAKDNLVAAKQLFGDHHPATRLAHRLYTQSVQVVTERYRLMAVNTLAYMDAVLA